MYITRFFNTEILTLIYNNFIKQYKFSKEFKIKKDKNIIDIWCISGRAHEFYHKFRDFKKNGLTVKILLKKIKLSFYEILNKINIKDIDCILIEKDKWNLFFRIICVDNSMARIIYNYLYKKSKNSI